MATVLAAGGPLRRYRRRQYPIRRHGLPGVLTVRGRAGYNTWADASGPGFGHPHLGYDPQRRAGTTRLAPGLWLRGPVVALVCLVLFMVAGMLSFPNVKHFYQSHDVLVMPPIGALLVIEFVRGLVYVGALAPLVRRMVGRRRHAALVAGLALSVLGGIAPLLLPVTGRWAGSRYHAVLAQTNGIVGPTTCCHDNECCELRGHRLTDLRTEDSVRGKPGGLPPHMAWLW